MFKVKKNRITFKMDTFSRKSIVTRPLFLFLLAFAIVIKVTCGQGKHIFLLAGQSNMAGLGGVVNNEWDGVVPPECLPNPSILKLNAALQWEEAKEPLDAGIDLKGVNDGIGPGMPFAHYLLAQNPSYGIIGLVPCAVSGSKIIQWQKGTDLYNTLVSRAKAALENGGGKVEALLWYQGESDTVSLSYANAYKGWLMQFILDLRADLDLPDLLVIEVVLASGIKRYLNIVRDAQLHTGLPFVKSVDAKGLPLGPDHLHLTTPAQVRLGRMLAEAFLQ